ncbi:hypothetical protein BC941DRAFT_427908 [Chlamydoabsidia padenii]|nr:hypothetical protein BC941DRAFT_427908 [Chlamydoabsidia padenii]
MPAPIGFSEDVAHGADTDYYVEWLDDEQSFPCLSSSPTAKHDQDTSDWQMIDEKQVDFTDQDLFDLTIKTVLDESAFESDLWEHIDYCHSPKSYVKLAAEAQDQLADAQHSHPFPSIHPYATHRCYKKISIPSDQGTDDWYNLYADRKSHGSHSHFGNKHYIERQRKIVIEEPWKRWGYGTPELTPRLLYQNITLRTHAKQYKPPGPRNANKNKERHMSRPCVEEIRSPFT